MTNPITDAQLDEIDARHNAATPGPWGSHRDLDGVYTIQARPRVTCAGMETDGDIATLAAGRTDAESYANARFIGHAREDVPALLAEVRRLRDKAREYGELAARRESELIFLRGRMEQIRHLHKDSPMGPCPVCIDADAAAAGGDGLVPYPCPTGRLAGAQDCDPPSLRAAAEETREIVHGCPPDGSGLTPCCGRTPFELPLSDRISSEAPVTCPGTAPVSA